MIPNVGLDITVHLFQNEICKPFTSLGEQCEFETEPGTEEICDPFIHICHKPEGYVFPQAGGTCQPIGKKYGLGDCCQVAVINNNSNDHKISYFR